VGSRLLGLNVESYCTGLLLLKTWVARKPAEVDARGPPPCIYRSPTLIPSPAPAAADTPPAARRP